LDCRLITLRVIDESTGGILIESSPFNKGIHLFYFCGVSSHANGQPAINYRRTALVRD
jgi:hypothetical protein